ncbi:MAG: molybdopterin oxidoreductase family protein [Rhodospirillales bacterium]|nr:molybdopterin oxidoreductase family protein [Rhodospirillales bacterium]
MTFVRTVCPHDCPSTCALEVERIDSRTIGRVRGSEANDYTAGVICAKVARYAERVHHVERLKTPLRRVGPKAEAGGRNRFEPCSWDEALDMTAGAMAEATAKHGAISVWPYFYAGTMGLVQRDGIHRLRHVMGYSLEDDTICTTLANSGWTAGTGARRGTDSREMAESDLVVFWGCNAVSTQVNAMHHAQLARKNRGAKIACVDVYRNPTMEAADIQLLLRPGTDGAFACAVMHVLFKEGFADRDYLARYTDADAKLESHLAARTPAWAAAITGIPEDEIVAFARLYGATPRSYIRLGYGFSRQRNGAAAMHAASCLPAVTGAWRHKGGGALYSQSGLYAGLDQSVIMGLDRLDPRVRALDQSRIGAVLMGEPAALLDGPPVHALFVQNTNPLVVAPDLAKVRAGFARQDLFVCVHEQFMTETAAVADVVLPATTFLEHDDIYRAGAHTWLQIGRKAIEPYAEARSNHDVLGALARRLGAEHPGFEMTAWEMIDDMLRRSGLPSAEQVWAAGGVDFGRSFEEMHFLNGFGWPDKKFRFAPDWKAIGSDHAIMPALPDQLDNIEKADSEHPFKMVAAPARNFLNSTFTETPGSQKREVRPTGLIHPADMARLGMAEGDRVRLGNRRASVVVHARAFDGVRPGVAVVEGIWPNKSFAEGLAINALIGDDRAPPAGGAAFHDTAVWVRKA